MAKTKTKKASAETKKTAGRRSAAAGAEAAKMQYPSPAFLKGLLKDQNLAIEDIAEIRGAMGSAIKDAAENKHLHRQAFATIKRLSKMSPEKLAPWLAHFNYMLDACGLTAKAKSAPAFSEIASREPNGGGEGEGEGEGNDDTVVEGRFPGASTAPVH